MHLLISQGLGGEDFGGAAAGVEGGEQADAERDGGDDERIDEARGEGQVVDGVDRGVEVDEAVVAAEPTDAVAEQRGRARCRSAR
jgi:hypothetical protein